MWRWTSRRAEGLAPAVALAVGLVGSLSAPPCRATLGTATPSAGDARHEGQDTTPLSVLLAVSVNGIDGEDMVRALRLPRSLALAEADWRTLNLRAPSQLPMVVDGRHYFDIDTLPGLRWQVDEGSQVLRIDAPASAFAGGGVLTTEAAPPAGVATAWGGFANYDLQWQHHDSVGANGRSETVQGLFELGTFGPAGGGRLTGLMRDNGAQPRGVRLETTWTHDRPADMASLRVGDAIGASGAWGRAMRFGGVQYATDFSTRPGFLTFPLPALQGEAALPSTLEVYVNNSRRLQGQVPAGPFQLTDVPIVTGSGQVRVVVRDLLGREQVIQQPYYASPALLRPGLSAFSYEMGAVRENYGVESDHYGRLFAAATERRGITDSFSRELRLELLGRQAAVGATGMWLVPGVGLLNLSAVGSHSDEREGALVMGALEHQGHDWNGSVQVRRASRGFSQAGQGAALAPHTQVTAALGTSWRGSALGLSAVHARGWDDADRQRLLSFNVARSLGRLATVSLIALRDMMGHGTTLAVSLSVALDGPTSASLGVTRNGQNGASTRSLQVQRAITESSDIGYQLSMDRGDTRRDTGQAIWELPIATLQAGISDGSAGREARIGASGALAFLDGSVFMARRIDGSFAVVDVGGIANVAVLHENRPVARTDARGRAIVSGLRGYEINRIGVDASGLPFDAQVDGLDLEVVPPARSGVVLRVPVRYSRGATFRLVDAEGEPLPAGTLVRVEGLAKTFPLGFDGRGFLTGVGAKAQVRTVGPLGACGALIEIAAGGDDLPDLGTVRCR